MGRDSAVNKMELMPPHCETIEYRSCTQCPANSMNANETWMRWNRFVKFKFTLLRYNKKLLLFPVKLKICWIILNYERFCVHACASVTHSISLSPSSPLFHTGHRQLRVAARLPSIFAITHLRHGSRPISFVYTFVRSLTRNFFCSFARQKGLFKCTSCVWEICWCSLGAYTTDRNFIILSAHS